MRPDWTARTGVAIDVPVVQTPRLVLRGLRDSDLEAYAAMCADDEVMRYIGPGNAVDADMAWRHMAAFMGSWALRGLGQWAVQERASGQLVGRVGYLDPPDWPGCEIGWLLARAHWGKGYALESALAARRCGRERLGVGSLISLIRAGNARSIALAQRLGAVHERDVDLMGQPAQLWRHPAAD